jgi:hypothetical protein
VQDYSADFLLPEALTGKSLKAFLLAAAISQEVHASARYSFVGLSESIDSLLC